jgi:hypothetical protein
MAKKQADRRPDEKPAKQNPAGPEVMKDADRTITESGERGEGFGRRPEGAPNDKPRPGRDDKGIFEGDRSDRESGRPIQLDDDDADDERGGGQSQEGSREGERTRR